MFSVRVCIIIYQKNGFLLLFWHSYNLPWLLLLLVEPENHFLYSVRCALFWSNFSIQESNDNLEDAGNELILTDEEVVRFQIGEVFAHVPKEEVENRIEELKEVTCKNLEKLEEEKESILAQMAELKQILYGKFKDSINLEED